MDQLNLFAPEPAPAATSRTDGFFGMPPGVRRRRERAMQPDVAEEVLAIARARSAEWLAREAFRAVIERHEIAFCFGHVLSDLARTGQLEERKVYFGRGVGAEKPGSPDYQGFGNEWRLPTTGAI